MNSKYSCIVLDLDLTVWHSSEIWIDHMRPPFRRTDQELLDSRSGFFKLYPDIIAILNLIKRENLLLAIASKTTRPDWAFKALKLFEIDECFEYMAIYPECKTQHLLEISNTLNVSFEEMLFFDDEYQNIVSGESLGVKSISVDHGLNLSLFEKYLYQ